MSENFDERKDSNLGEIIDSEGKVIGKIRNAGTLVNTGNRKDIVKNVAIGFLSVMLILTFFSNTIMNYTLPQVATVQIESGSISPQIRGTGTVTAEDPYNITVKETRKISGVAVKEGAHVEIGDVIYYLEDKESEELTEAKDKLDDLELAYEQALFSGAVPNDVITRVRNGKTATFDTYQVQLKDVNDRYDAAVQAAADAQATVTYLTTSKTIDTNEVNYNALTPEYSGDQASADKENIDVKRTAVSTELTTTGSRLDAINNLIVEKTSLDSMDSSTSEYTIAKTQYENNKTVYESLYGKVDDLQAEQDHVSKKYIDLKSEYNAYDSKIQDLDVFLNNASKDISQLGTYVKQLGITYDQKLAKANQIKSEADAALKVITDERDKALKSINTEISLCSQRDRITAQKEKIAKLEAESVGASVKSPVAGIVSSVNKVAGESTAADETIAVIQVDGKDMTTSFSVSNSQAQKLKVGDAAEPQNAWQFSSNFKATLTAIKNDKQDPAGKKLLTFKIESTEVTPGQSLSLAIGERSQNYDMIVPNSAIKTDTNGKFVLIVKSKSSPLGNRYTATRADVTVVASDDKNSAITAAIDDYEYVITTANKPVKAGEQVRLSNE